MDHCQLCCIGKPPSQHQNYYASRLPQIIASCNKYLGKDVLRNWKFSFTPDPFCQDCVQSTVQLLELDLQLEQINYNIKQLVARISDKIVNERKKYELFRTAENVFPFQNDFLLPSQTFANLGSRETTATTIQEADKDFNSCDFSNNSCDDDTFASSSPLQGQTSNEISNPSVNPHNPVSFPSQKNDRKQISATKAKVTNIETKSVVTSSDLQLKRGASGFECPKCNKRFARVDILHRHNCDSQTFECPECGKSFFSQGSLNLHKKIHTGEKPHKCETCGKCFGLPHHLRLHIRTHTGERPYECDICKKRFNDIGYLAKHKLQHSADESERRKYKCDICSKSFTLYRTLRNHLTRHTGESNHKCDICGEAFGSTSILQSHIMVHTKEKLFPCSVCWRSFGRRSTLKQHMLTHNKEKKYQCEKCGKGFFSPGGLQLHNETKHNESESRDYVCDICGRAYATLSIVTKHRRSHNIQKSKSSEKFTCVVCGQIYSREYDLIRHQKITHTVCTRNGITCEKCGKLFEDYVNFHRHSKRRMGRSEKQKFRFECDVCQEALPTRCELYCHFKEKHADTELPHKCTVCNNLFMTRHELSLHKRQNAECSVKGVNAPTKKKSKKKRREIAPKKIKKRKVDSDSEMEESDDNDSAQEKSKNKAAKRSKQKVKDSRTDINSQELRRSSRVRTVKKEVSYDTDDSDEDNLDEGDSSAESDNAGLVQIKKENEDWIKQEPEDYDD